MAVAPSSCFTLDTCAHVRRRGCTDAVNSVLTRDASDYPLSNSTGRVGITPQSNRFLGACTYLVRQSARVELVIRNYPDRGIFEEHATGRAHDRDLSSPPRRAVLYQHRSDVDVASGYLSRDRPCAKSGLDQLAAKMHAWTPYSQAPTLMGC